MHKIKITIDTGNTNNKNMVKIALKHPEDLLLPGFCGGSQTSLGT